MTNNHETAEMAYTRNSIAAQEKAERLLQLLKNSANEKTNRNWGDVGSMTHVAELLDEVLSFYGK